MAHIHYYMDSGDQVSPFLEPRLLYTGVVRDDPKWLSQAHSHSFCEILYVLRGTGTVTLHGHRDAIGEGDLVVINALEEHAEKSDEANPLHFVFLAMDGFQLEGQPENCLILTGTPHVIPSGCYRYKIESYFTDLISETSSRVGYYDIISRSLVQAIAVLILRIRLAGAAPPHSVGEECQKVKAYIDTHYTSSISLESLCETVYISKHHMAHLFKQQTGISPIQYLIQKRIAEACRLLRESNLTVAEIAERVGYGKSVYFSQTFKKAVGLSPLVYRKTNR